MTNEQLRTEAPIALDELSTAIGGSRLARRVRVGWRSLNAAVGESRLLQLAHTTASRAPEASIMLLLAAWVLGVGMVVHLSLLAFAEPYSFPSRSTYILPTVLLVLSVVVMVLHRPIAAAWRDRQSRSSR